MRAVRLRDVSGTAWTLAWGFTAPTRSRHAHGILAAAALPVWLLAVLALPGFVHADQRVVARLTRRSSTTTLVTLARGAAILFTAYVLLILVLIAVLKGWLPAAATTGTFLVFALYAMLAVFVTVAQLAPGYLRIYRAGARARRADSREQRRADRDLYRSAHWSLDSVASRLPVGGLTVIDQYVRQSVPPGDRVVAQAASSRHVAVYRRYGFTPLATAPMTLHAGVTPVPRPSDSAPLYSQPMPSPSRSSLREYPG